MKYNKYNYIVGALLTIFLVLFISATAKADCIDDSQNGDGEVAVEWTPATERTDDSSFPSSENGGYKVYYTDTSDGTDCARRIPDKTMLASTFNLYLGKRYDFNVTQLDTGGRESVFSRTLSITVTKKIILVGVPAYPDFTFERVGNTFDYVLSFPQVTKYADGSDLPVTPEKYYLFDNGAWVKDVHYSDLPMTFTMTKGIHELEMETEINVNGSYHTSERTPAFVVDVQDYIDIPIVIPEPPKALDPVRITVPDGYDLLIEFVPQP